jgi:16S rRNA (guanine527-N7)-methyltransferase
VKKEEFYEAFTSLNIEITEEQKMQLDQFYQLIIKWNKVMNLTTITKENDVYLKHFYDSLTLIRATDFRRNISLCDVGSGAGIPGVVLKILFPHIKVVLIDSLNKRVQYLNEVIKELNLKDIVAIHTRMEEYSREHEEQFDIITARAVANLNFLTEISIRALKVGGKLIFLKGKCEEELENLKKVAQLFYILIFEVIYFQLPIENSDRTIVSLVKTDKTSDRFPRSIDKIKKNPCQ